MNWLQKIADQMPPLYHGTDREFQKFHFRRHRSGGKAIFLTPNLANAQAYGAIVYEVKPISSRMFNPDQDIDELEKMIDNILEKESQKLYGQGKSFYPYTRRGIIRGIKNKKWINMEHPIIIEALNRLKFDGFTAQEGADINYAFFNPNNLELIRKVDNEQLQNSLLNDPELRILDDPDQKLQQSQQPNDMNWLQKITHPKIIQQAAIYAWHGTKNTNFTTFNEAFTRSQLGFHFGTKEQSNDVFGEEEASPRIIYARLDINNPLRMPDLGGWTGHYAKQEFEKALGVNMAGSGSDNEIIRAVQNAGYDGIVYANKFEGDGDSFIVFNSSQITIINDTTNVQPSLTT